MKRDNILKTISLLLFASLLGGFISAVVIYKINKDDEKNTQTIKLVTSPQMQVTTTAFSGKGEPVNFSDAAEHAVSSVVHVKVAYEPRKYYSGGGGDIFDYFFGIPEKREYKEYTPRSSGSGVIISADGYIITNNHVIDKANEVTVTFNDKTTLTAKVVGKDPNTDIALLKVETKKDLPALGFSDSDNLRIGEWVLAVGNPFNFTSTVTAGIVSAKARQLYIIPSEFSIESFIQTDAAVNPGNSGGALVNLKGELVGINTAIASRSGQYEGYSFAVPSNIAKKVVEDLMQYGVVQRALLGITYRDLSDIPSDVDLEELEEIIGIKSLEELEKLQEYKGVYVSSVLENSAAKEAGLLKGDIIIKIGGKDVVAQSTVIEEVGKLRPGDKIEIVVIRDGKTKQFTALLRNKAGNTDIVSADGSEILGAKFEEVNKTLAKKLNIDGGLQVVELFDGKLKEKNVKKGFIITKINQHVVTSKEDLVRVLNSVKGGGVFIEGVYPNGRPDYIAFGFVK
ncbi:MAG: trypsin-like peptidase domain-containing protein [Prevotellaceae bacterium]|jgi:Do/DeqQ family serine protease|nr:trypsin-like peptidase domain-containing protein [Prevotellaceae bacterium]